MGTNQGRASPVFDQSGRRVIQADGSELISLAEPQAGESRAAQVCRVCQYRIENRLQISRRTADDLEHLGGGCLLLKRLVKLTGTPVEFFLEISSRYVCGRRFASLGPNRALALHRLS